MGLEYPSMTGSHERKKQNLALHINGVLILGRLFLVIR